MRSISASNSIINHNNMDFWKKYANSYLTFSQHCDYSDWRRMIETIAEEILKIAADRALSVLDVGAGTGKNIAEILEYILSKTNKPAVLDVVEPSEYAKNLMSAFMVRTEYGGFLNKVYDDAKEIHRGKYDAILFMHASYEITDFKEVLLKLYETNLNQRGKILILSVSSASCFFLGREELIKANVSDEIISMLNDYGIPHTVQQLDSRFHLSGNGKADPNSFEYFYNFMTDKKIPLDEFKYLLNKANKQGEINFKDDLIAITRE